MMTEERLKEITRYAHAASIDSAGLKPAVLELVAEVRRLTASADAWARRALENKRECGEAGALLVPEINRLRQALEFYGGSTNEGGLAFMPAPGRGFLATETNPGECARAALQEKR